MAFAKRAGLAMAIALFGGGILLARDFLVAAVVTPQAMSAAESGGPGWTVRTILTALGATLIAAAAWILITGWDQRTRAAWLRCDWFLPALRKSNDDHPRAASAAGRWLRRVVPESWQSNHRTKRRGKIRQTLRALGPSWLQSPLRRGMQAICLITFLGLFFYVCWPYTARPRPEAAAGGGWQLASVEQASGTITLIDGSLPTPFRGLVDSQHPPARIYAGLAADTSQPAPVVVAFEVREAALDRVALLPTEPLPAPMVEAILGGSATWTIWDRDPTAWPDHYADDLSRKEWLPAESFLIIDPLVSLSTAIASRQWVWSLACAAAILIVCLLIPRGFCGYVCPLGTTIDLFDWVIGKRVERFRVSGDGWWVHIKYYLLAGTLLCAVGGVLVSGYVSAIPVITRGMLFLFEPAQTAALRGPHLVAPLHVAHLLSLALFLSVLALGFLRPRFWCKYVCPSGALFSLGNLFRLTERKVESSCIHCNKCVEVCPFDAIKPDFTTRTTDCTLCQTCGGVCPTHAIKFVERGNLIQLKVENDPPTRETALGRRGFLSVVGGGAAAVVGAAAATGATRQFGANLDHPDAFRPIRPPGSVPEKEFLEMCIRCGECFKACPNNVLQAEGFQQGLEGLWTPLVNADWAGCESSCNACGQVCPTGAIRALPLEEKRFARMGLAIVNQQTCLPLAQKEACDLCVQECDAAGYHAIEYTQVGTEVDAEGRPIEGTGFLAPVVLEDACVGCGLCQTRCYAINVKDRGVLSESAIIIEAGPGREDRLLEGSYRELSEQRIANRKTTGPSSDFFVPETANAPAVGNETEPNRSVDQPDPFDADPFGADPFGTAPSSGTGDPSEPAGRSDDDPFGTGDGS